VKSEVLAFERNLKFQGHLLAEKNMINVINKDESYCTYISCCNCNNNKLC